MGEPAVCGDSVLAYRICPEYCDHDTAVSGKNVKRHCPDGGRPPEGGELPAPLDPLRYIHEEVIAVRTVRLYRIAFPPGEIAANPSL